MSKILGFLLGVAVALAGPAVFGVLAAPGGIELNAKGMALAYGIGALVFWAVVSYFSGAGALGAFAAFGTLVYCWLWIPNRTTNFLNDVPGVTNGMIEGSKQYTLNGVVPVLGVISLVYSIQLIVRGVRRRRRDRVEAERLQREQEAAQAQQEADVAAVYPVAGGTYQEPAAYQPHSSYDDLFDEPEPVQPRNQADEQTRQFPVGAGAGFEQTRQFPAADAESNQSDEETVVAAAPAAEPQQEEPAAPTPEEQAAQQVPAAPVDKQPKADQDDEPTQPAPVQEAAAKQEPEAEATPVKEAAPAAEVEQPVVAKPEVETPAEAAPVAPKEAAEQAAAEEADPGADAAEEAAGGEAKPVENKPVGGAATGEQQAKMTPKEHMGSQYRERMEDPEDTGEFFLSAFENPAVKPA